MLLQWSEQLSVGLDELNDHHKYIISLINRLDDALIEFRGNEVASEIIAELFDYACYHFGAEEALFETMHYPYAAEHIDRHMEFRRLLQQLRGHVEVGDQKAGMELRDFLFIWWTNHILQWDKRYVPYLSADKMEPAGHQANTKK